MSRSDLATWHDVRISVPKMVSMWHGHCVLSTESISSTLTCYSYAFMGLLDKSALGMAWWQAGTKPLPKSQNHWWPRSMPSTRPVSYNWRYIYIYIYVISLFPAKIAEFSKQRYIQMYEGKWQFPVQTIMKMSSKWGHLHFSIYFTSFCTTGVTQGGIFSL